MHQIRPQCEGIADANTFRPRLSLTESWLSRVKFFSLPTTSVSSS